MSISRREFLATTAGAVAAASATGAPLAASDAGGHGVLKGVCTALFTPYTADNRINGEMIARMVEYGIRNGVAGFYLTGGTGEGLLLSKAERKEVYRAAAAAACGRAKLIAHVGAVNTDDAVELARFAADVGCDWVSSVPPVYYGQKFAEALNHYRLISEATDLPFLIYSVGGAAIDPERDARIFDLKNVYGMKYTGTDFYSVQRLRRRIGKDVTFVSGSDQHFIAALAYPDVFTGCIGTVQNVIPATFVRICRAMARNDWRSAAEAQAEANRVVEFVCHTFPKQSFRKAAMRYIGLDCGPFRHPYEPLTEAEYAAFAAKADALGLFKRNQAVL